MFLFYFILLVLILQTKQIQLDYKKTLLTLKQGQFIKIFFLQIQTYVGFYDKLVQTTPTTPSMSTKKGYKMHPSISQNSS